MFTTEESSFHWETNKKYIFFIFITVKRIKNCLETGNYIMIVKKSMGHWCNKLLFFCIVFFFFLLFCQTYATFIRAVFTVDTWRVDARWALTLFDNKIWFATQCRASGMETRRLVAIWIVVFVLFVNIQTIWRLFFATTLFFFAFRVAIRPGPRLSRWSIVIVIVATIVVFV